MDRLLLVTMGYYGLPMGYYRLPWVTVLITGEEAGVSGGDCKTCWTSDRLYPPLKWWAIFVRPWRDLFHEKTQETQMAAKGRKRRKNMNTTNKPVSTESPQTRSWPRPFSRS
jgi:hypothetical protein